MVSKYSQFFFAVNVPEHLQVLQFQCTEHVTLKRNVPAKEVVPMETVLRVLEFVARFCKYPVVIHSDPPRSRSQSNSSKHLNQIKGDNFSPGHSKLKILAKVKIILLFLFSLTI